MYLLETVDVSPDTTFAMTSLSKPTSLKQWHQQLMHCSPLMIQEMAWNNPVDGLILSEMTMNGKCKDCILGRQTHCPFDGETKKNLEPLDLVVFNLWGPSHVQSAGGKVYFMVIVDGGTSYKHGVYLANKTDNMTISAFDNFCTKTETPTGRKIHCLRTDWAYESAAWENCCRSSHPTQVSSPLNTSNESQMGERIGRTGLQTLRHLLLSTTTRTITILLLAYWIQKHCTTYPAHSNMP